MGDGFGCRCSKCRYSFSAIFGVGFFYPSVYERTLQEAREGEYGKATADFLRVHPDAAINAGSSVYICPKCRNLQCETNMGLYLKKENTEIPEDNTPWSAEFAAEGVEFVDPSSLRKYYKLRKPYNHVCEKCKTKMKHLPERTFLRAIEQHELMCPECGAELGELDMLLWD